MSEIKERLTCTSDQWIIVFLVGAFKLDNTFSTIKPTSSLPLSVPALSVDKSSLTPSKTFIISRLLLPDFKPPRTIDDWSATVKISGSYFDCNTSFIDEVK